MHSKSKKSKRQAQPRAQRRCQKLAKTRRQGQGTAHGPRPTRNQHEVAKRLLAGEVAMVGGTGWAFVEPFLAFLGEVGFFEGLRIDGARFIRQMAELSLLLLTYQVKVLLGLAGMNCVGQTLFRDRALLKLIGYTTVQWREGFCQRGTPDKQKPLHKNVLADAVEKLTAEEVGLHFERVDQALGRPRVVRGESGALCPGGQRLGNHGALQRLRRENRQRDHVVAPRKETDSN